MSDDNEIKINNPHALYYNGELVGIILNPDPLPDGMFGICEGISPHEALADAITIPTKGKDAAFKLLRTVLENLDVKDVIYPDLNLNFDPSDYGIRLLELPITPTNSDIIRADPGMPYFEYNGCPMIEDAKQQFVFTPFDGWKETTKLRGCDNHLTSCDDDGYCNNCGEP